MALPAGYSQDDAGWYWKSDNTGPYSRSSGEVMTLLAGDIVSVPTEGFTVSPSGFYYGTDGSGPFVKGPSGIYKLIG